MTYSKLNTHWITANGVPVFHVPRPAICDYADNSGHALALWDAECDYIAACLNAGHALPRPETED